MILKLLAALLVPWAAGVLWLTAVRQFQGHAPHPGRSFRLWGYGFFLGYAMLYGVITGVDAAFDGVASWVVFTSVFLLTAAGALAWRVSRGLVDQTDGSGSAHGNRVEEPRVGVSLLEKVLTRILYAWIALHLALATADVMTTATLPWDAWLLWLYRAKAWFFSNGLTEMVSPAAWNLATTVPPYTVDAVHYPEFLSVIVFWTALSMGQWSETWVNLPGLLCAIAIGLALGGHLLKLGLRPSIIAALVYLLYSTPLFGAHISLGGYADIWMAGYAGLGLVALISGLSRRETGYVLLGLAMLAFSILIKNEGWVWLPVGAALIVFITLPVKLRWAGAAGVAVLFILAGVTGWSHVELPGLGLLGIADGRFHLPFAGWYAFEAHNVWPDYLKNLFLLGSWNLLWAMVLAAMLFMLPRLDGRDYQACLGFLLLLMASQGFIFGFTSQGEWARQYTAINRLPLQLLPTVLFAVGVVLSGAFKHQVTAPKSTVLWAAPLLSLLLAVTGVMLWLSENNNESQRSIQPELQFVMGAGAREGPEIRIDRYQQGFALLSSGAVDLNAAAYPFLDIELTSARFEDPDLAPAFFWRQAASPDVVHRQTLEGNGLLSLAGNKSWSGAISEFGLLIPQIEDASPGIRQFALETATLPNRWERAWRGWLAYEPWSLRSINFIWGGADQQELWLPPLVLIWALLTWLLWFAMRGIPKQQGLAMGAMVWLAAWMVLDLRWTANGARQLVRTALPAWSMNDRERLASAPDGPISDMLDALGQPDHASNFQRVLVVGDAYDFVYFLQRAKYHLLPHSGRVVDKLDRRFLETDLDYVIFIGDYAGGKSWAETWSSLPVKDIWRERLELVSSSELAILFRVDH